jgi:hypothetical protein
LSLQAIRVSGPERPGKDNGMSDQPTDATAVDEADEADRAAVSGGAGRDGGPQDSDDMAAADGLSADPEVAREYGDMLERGAHQRGEGRVP